MRKGLMVLSLVLACLALVAELAHVWRGYEFGSFGTSDFIEYWSAGQLLRQGKSPYDFDALYNVERSVGWLGETPLIMWNPPWTLTLMLPLAFLPFNIAAFLWFCVNLAILFACSATAWRLFVPERFLRQVEIAWIAAFVFMPAIFTLQMGQISSLVLLGVAGFLFFVARGNDILAGACLALTMVKPHVIYLLLVTLCWWIATRRRWRVLLGLAAALVGLTAVVLCFSPHCVEHYLLAMREPPLYWRTPTLGGVLRILLGWEHRWLQFFPSVILSLATLICLIVKAAEFDWDQAISPILLISVPTAAYGWSFDQVVLLIPYIQVISLIVQNGRERIASSAPVLLVLLLTNGLMCWQNWRGLDDLYQFWAPLALGAIYIYSRVALCHGGHKEHK